MVFQAGLYELLCIVVTYFFKRFSPHFSRKEGQIRMDEVEGEDLRSFCQNYIFRQRLESLPSTFEFRRKFIKGLPLGKRKIDYACGKIAFDKLDNPFVHNEPVVVVLARIFVAVVRIFEIKLS